MSIRAYASQLLGENQTISRGALYGKLEAKQIRHWVDRPSLVSVEGARDLSIATFGAGLILTACVATALICILYTAQQGGISYTFTDYLMPCLIIGVSGSLSLAGLVSFVFISYLRQRQMQEPLDLAAIEKILNKVPQNVLLSLPTEMSQYV